MNINPTTEAVLLLTSSLGKSARNTLNPLTPSEWGEFAAWLKERSLRPSDLLQCDLAQSLKMWEHPKVSISRVERLLNRGAALGFALEKWERAGLWVVTRADGNYPSQLKRRLGRNAPPILYGCGNADLLNTNGIAVVGSRDADDRELCVAEKVGRRAAECGEIVVSGGAAGIDREAMFGALNALGSVIGVLPDRLLRSSTNSDYREHLLNGNLALVSPFDPEAHFSVANAMARNRYIYCLAHDAIVVSSKPDRGGTWRGAIENLKHGWVPLLVALNDAENSGNSGLVERGGRWLENFDDDVFGRQTHRDETAPHDQGRLSLDSTETEKNDQSISAAQTGRRSDRESPVQKSIGLPTNEIEKPSFMSDDDPAEDLYMKARSLIFAYCTEPKPANDIANALGVTKPTADIWIKRLVEERELRKVSKPVRYVASEKDLLDLNRKPRDNRNIG